MTAKSKRGNLATVIGVGLALLGAALILARVFVYEPFRIPSSSMEPTLRQGDYILVYKWPYGRYGSFGKDVQVDALRSAKPRRGEIVVFNYPPNPKISYVKRIIGLPGDRIAFAGHEVSVNGVPVKHEQGAAHAYARQGSPEVRGHLHRESIGDVSYEIFLEDAPGHGTASGAVVVPPGHYFVLGDNRDHAADSRYWGMVPEQNIFGKAVRIWMSDDPNRIGPLGP